MSKARTVGAKRRAKKLAREFGIPPTPRREKNGCYVDRVRQQPVDPDPQRTALEARARRMGAASDKANDMNRVRLSEPAGMALDILCGPDEAERLWGHYVALTAAEARYHRSLGKSIHAKTAKIEMMQERFETRPDDAIDLRTEEERDRDAVSSWMRWQGAIGKLDGMHQSAIYSAYRRHMDLVDTGEVLPAGKRFVDAMQRLDVVL